MLAPHFTGLSCGEREAMPADVLEILGENLAVEYVRRYFAIQDSGRPVFTGSKFEGSSRLVVKPDQRLRNRFDTRRSIPALFKPLSAMSRTLGDDMELEYSPCILEYAVGEHTGV